MISIVHRREFWLEWLCAVPLVMVLAGSGLLFGGAVWWFRPLAMMGVSLAVAGGLVRIGCLRTRLFLRSPLLLAALLLGGWATAQLVPLPRAVVRNFAPMADRVNAQGLSPANTGAATDAAATGGISSRIPISLNRSEGVRGLLCLAVGGSVFWFVGVWTDRLPKLLLVMGLLVALGMINSALVCLQLMDGSTGLYGLFQPDQRMFVGPGWVDLSAAPQLTRMENLPAANPQEAAWAVQRPVSAGLVGMMPGGLVAWACLQSAAVPALFGCLCYLAQRRGSRFGIVERLRDRGVLTLWLVMAASLLLTSLLAGSVGKLPVLLPISGGVLMAAFFAMRADLEKRVTLALAVLFTAGVAGGLMIGRAQDARADQGFDGIWHDWSVYVVFMKDSLLIWRHSGWTGIGLGAYSSVAPYLKHSFVQPSSSVSSLLTLFTELGLPAVVLGICCMLWATWRMLTRTLRVDAEHRCLLGAVLGSAAGLMMGVALMPGWGLPLLTLMACSILGLADRCLCGASDLFVESWEGV